jgi:flagellar hook-basal body complex protein FliE
MASPTIAANAYSNLARLVDGGFAGKSAESLTSMLKDTSAGKTSETGGPSFATMLKESIGGVVDAGRKSDSQTVAMASGKANVVDVVTAVAETEVAVGTLVSVRDRVIQSYEEIMRMPI